MLLAEELIWPGSCKSFGYLNALKPVQLETVSAWLGFEHSGAQAKHSRIKMSFIIHIM